MSSTDSANRLRLVAIPFVALAWLLNSVFVRLVDITGSVSAQAALCGLIFGQLGLLAIWCALDLRELATKVGLAVLAAAALAQPLALTTLVADAEWWGMFAAFSLLAVGGVFLLSPRNAKPRQFSLFALFSLTTALAILTRVAPLLAFPGWRPICFGVALAVSLVGMSLLLHCKTQRWAPLIAVAFQLLAVLICWQAQLPPAVVVPALLGQALLVLSGIGIRSLLGAERIGSSAPSPART